MKPFDDAPLSSRTPQDKVPFPGHEPRNGRRSAFRGPKGTYTSDLTLGTRGFACGSGPDVDRGAHALFVMVEDLSIPALDDDPAGQLVLAGLEEDLHVG